MLGRARDPEINDFRARDVIVRQDDIVWRDVTVNDTVLMSRLEAGSETVQQSPNRLERQRAFVEYIG